MKNREIGIDLLKIVACFLIVAIHTVDARLGVFCRLISMITVVAIPVFFAINGYLLLNRENPTDYKYVCKKIKKIMIVCFAWEVLYSIAYFIVYHELRNFIVSFVLDFVQKGFFFQFWFLGALILIYIILPPLSKLLYSNSILYKTILIGLGIICVLIDLTQFMLKNQFTAVIPRTFRLYLWLFYFMLGGWISATSLKIKTSVCSIVAVTGSCISMGWMWFCRQTVFSKLDVAMHYGALPTIITVGSLILLAKIIPISGKKTIEFVSSLTMGIFIIHADILEYWIHFFPLLKSSEALNILCCVLVFSSSAVATILIKRIPVIKELVRI